MKRPHARFSALLAPSVWASGRAQVGLCEEAGTLEADKTLLVALPIPTWAMTGRPGFQQRYDRHWTPTAPNEFTTTLVGTEPGENAIFEREERCGDLPDTLMEPVSLYETRKAGEGDLFVTQTPLVALAGTSLSTKPHNFGGFLSDSLGQPVLNVAVHSGCGEAALVTNRAAVADTEVRLLTNTDSAVIGPDYYLRLQASDLSLVEFDIGLTNADGSVDVAPIVRSTRVANIGEYYLELSREISAPPTEVSLTVPAATTGTVAAQLCRVLPSGALASARGRLP